MAGIKRPAADIHGYFGNWSRTLLRLVGDFGFRSRRGGMAAAWRLLRRRGVVRIISARPQALQSTAACIIEAKLTFLAANIKI